MEPLSEGKYYQEARDIQNILRTVGKSDIDGVYVSKDGKYVRFDLR